LRPESSMITGLSKEVVTRSGWRVSIAAHPASRNV